VASLCAQGGVFAPYFLHGAAAAILAEHHALIPVYATYPAEFTADQMRRTIADLSRARWVLMPRDDYLAYLKAESGFTATTRDGLVPDSTPTKPGDYAAVVGFPLSMRPVNPSFKPDVLFGRALTAGWTVDHLSGDFVILRRNIQTN